MKVVYIKGQELDAVKPKKARKPTEKQLWNERVHRWILKQELRAYNRSIKKNAERIAEIKKHLPDWELPRPTLADVKLRHPCIRHKKSPQ